MMFKLNAERPQIESRFEELYVDSRVAVMLLVNSFAASVSLSLSLSLCVCAFMCVRVCVCVCVYVCVRVLFCGTARQLFGRYRVR